MAAEANSYIPTAVAEGFRKQAWRVWSIGLAVVGSWAGLILLAPLARSLGLIAISDPIYRFFHFICHQIPERSFNIMGEQFGVCSRCSGVYFGLVIGFLIYPLWRRIEEIEPLARFWLILSLIPIGIDWSLTIFGIWENTQFSRVATGIILGVACATYIVPALVEIVRNTTLRRRHG